MIATTLAAADPMGEKVLLVRRPQIDAWDGKPDASVMHVVLEHEVKMDKLLQTATAWSTFGPVLPLLDKLRAMFPNAKRGWYGAFPWPHWVKIHGVVGANPVQPYSQRLDLCSEDELSKTLAACEFVANALRNHVEWWCPSIYPAYTNLEGCREVAEAQVARMADVVGRDKVLPFITPDLFDHKRNLVDFMSPSTFDMYQAAPAFAGCGNAVLWTGLPWYVAVACWERVNTSNEAALRTLMRTIFHTNLQAETPEPDDERWSSASFRSDLLAMSYARIRRLLWVMQDRAAAVGGAA
ncbi:MAG: hypothetical protein RIS45_874 [Planctomycetota bacterium]